MTKTRFCPSPTGYVHLGNLRTALFNALLAYHDQGTFLLRIEDTDLSRSDVKYIKALCADLRWLHLNWQEGYDAEGDLGPYAQSKRGDIYEPYYQQLCDQGHAYWCFCTEEQLSANRERQLASGKPPRYPGTCRHLTADEIKEKRSQRMPASLRFRIPFDQQIHFDDLVRGPQLFASADLGDFIIQKSDGSPSFMFSNAVDDALMGVTHALRGEDHLTNTPRQLLILKALGMIPPQYGHISLIIGADGSPLSKRHGSKSLRDLAEQGFLPKALLNYLARLGHYYESDDLMTLEQLAAGFQVKGLGQAPARFDYQQLRYWQKTALAALETAEYYAWLEPHLPNSVPKKHQQAFMDLLRPNIVLPEELAMWAEALFADKLDYSEHALVLLGAADVSLFTCFAEVFSECPDHYQQAIALVQSRLGVSGKSLFKPLRAALTGRDQGPELEAVVALMGPRRVQARFRHVGDWLKSQKGR